MKVACVDLDGTLCEQMPSGQYEHAPPRLDVIAKVNKLHRDGWRIVIFTARGMNTCLGDAERARRTWESVTLSWLFMNGVEFDELKFGKPAADIYVDDKAVLPELFVSSEQDLLVRR
jgi:capsule biosynthesis phosphatase